MVLNVLENIDATSKEGGTAGQTVITIGNRVEGATYKYSTEEPVKMYKQDLTSWTELTEGEPITATNGATIYIAQTDSSGKAVGAGSVTAIVKRSKKK